MPIISAIIYKRDLPDIFGRFLIGMESLRDASLKHVPGDFFQVKAEPGDIMDENAAPFPVSVTLKSRVLEASFGPCEVVSALLNECCLRNGVAVVDFPAYIIKEDGPFRYRLDLEFDQPKPA